MPHKRIGPLKPWVCSYVIDDIKFGITLYSTSAEELEYEWKALIPNFKVDGELIKEIPNG